MWGCSGVSFTKTNIRWTDYTWNPVHGCSKTSEGCRNCYAERVSHKFEHTSKPWVRQNAESNIQLRENYLDDRIPETAWAFVNSMSDLYHELVPDEFVEEVYGAIRDMPESAFQILTKHGADQDRDIPYSAPDNAMVGVSVENADRTYRIDWLRRQPAQTRFISFEPLVGPIEGIDLSDIDWAIIGGESGPQRREMDPGWARWIIRECREQDVAVFFKQHSAFRSEEGQTIRVDGEEQRIEEFPDLVDGVLPRPRKHINWPEVRA